MEERKRKRGRPKIDAHLSEATAPSRRQAVNEKYMFDAVHLISVAATEIPDSQLLWHSDDLTKTAKGRNGILEQIGRMLEQDHAPQTDCVYVTNLAIRAVKAGHTTREIERALREIRKALKPLTADPENEALLRTMGLAVNALEKMGAGYESD